MYTFSRGVLIFSGDYPYIFTTSPTPTITPTVTPSPTPTPTVTISPTPTPSPTITPNMSMYISGGPVQTPGGGFTDFQFVRTVHTGDNLTLTYQIGQGDGVSDNNWVGVAVLSHTMRDDPSGIIWRRYGTNPVDSPPGISINSSLVIPIDYNQPYFLILYILSWNNGYLFSQQVQLN